MNKRWIMPEQWQPSTGIQLDETTLEAVRSNRNIAIVAGPGAGKTELLAQRASFLLQTNQCPEPRRILAISFKRDAAKTLKDRVQARCGSELAARFESYTFDAFAKGLVDRFSQALPAWCRPTHDYKLVFPGWRDWNDFAQRLQPPSPFDDRSVNGSQMQAVHATPLLSPGPLPIDPPSPINVMQWASSEWWRSMLSRHPSQLTLPMISTLVATVLAHNPQIQRALRQTYSHIFLDEYQDTTALQYAVLKAAFAGSNAILTAVGDTKQRIMTWAGAAPEAFSWLEHDFGAQTVALLINFRSNCRIVEIVNAMATSIEQNAARVTCARENDPVPQPSDALLYFQTPGLEAQFLASAIRSEVEPREGGGELRPEDFLLLVRQSAAEIEDQLAQAFTAKGLTIRNEARPFAGIAIQELMTEPLTDLFIGILQLAQNDRQNDPFTRVRTHLEFVMGVDEDRPESMYRLDEAIRKSIRAVQKLLGPEPQMAGAEELVDGALSGLTEGQCQRLAPDYERRERLAEVRVATVEFLKDALARSENWDQVITLLTGRGQVRLMTIHKSKGMEAHTVIFLRLQNNSFHRNADMDEEKLNFFVAVSRARERLFITHTSTQQDRVSPLLHLAEVAGIKPMQPPT